MSLNRHSSSRRKLNKSKTRRRKSSESSVNYQSLEERRLLAVDIGLNFTGTTFGRPMSPPNQTGGVGPNHVIEVTNNQFQIFDKTTGALLVNKPLDQFWTDTGGAGAQSSAQMVAGTSNARVLYDVDTRRWFISSVSSADIITGAPGTQAPTLVAVSRTTDPTLDWQSLRNIYDVNNDGFPDTIYDGGFLSAFASPSSTSLSVDDHNLYVTIADGPAPQTWAFNKFADLVVPTPNSANPSAYFVGSSQLQWGSDVTGEAVGAFGVFAPPAGNEIFLSQFTDPELPGNAVLQPDVAIAVDTYEAPPLFIRQEFDPDLVNAGAGFLSASKRIGNSLWAVHSILGSGNGENPDGGVIETSALRWYEIDLDTKTVKQSGTIEHDYFNYIYPSIAVTPEGHIAISYTATGVGPTTGEGLFPTLSVSVGYSNNGTMIMEDRVDLKVGEAGYFDGAGNFWGRYGETVVDPNDPTKVWVFGQWSDNSDNGQTQIVEVSLLGLSPELEGTADDNIIVVRRSALDDTQIEVEIDGTVVQTYQKSILYSIQLDGLGGNDTFIVDTSEGGLDLPEGIHFIGDGDDSFVADSILDAAWVIDGDGAGNVTIDGLLAPISFEGIDMIDASHGVDSFDVQMTDTDLVINGRSSDDSFLVNNSGIGIVTVNGNTGMDDFTVNNSGGGVNLSGNEETDTFTFDDVGTGISSLSGNDGDDVFDVLNSGTAGVTINGNSGADTINIDDPAGTAPLIAFGNDGVDTFNVVQTIGNGDYFGGDGNDLFNIESAVGVSRFFGQEDVDRFVISDHELLGSAGLLHIDGGADQNQMVVNGYQGQTNMAVVTSSRITGMSAVPIEYTASGSFTIPGGLGGIQLIGSDTLNDAFNVNTLLATNTLDIQGGGGNDRIFVGLGALGEVSGDGQAGSDVYRYEIGSESNRLLYALDSGLAGSDRIVATLSEGNDHLNLSGQVISFRTDNLEFNMNFESMVIDARGGDDVIDINPLVVGFLRILGGNGKDDINVRDFTGVNNMLIQAGAGNDDILIDAGAAPGVLAAYGGDGDDSFLVTQSSFGNAVLDGQEGSDRYDIFYAVTSPRYVVARDSGVADGDHLSVYGTDLDDDMEFRSGVVRSMQQRVLYSETTETMTLLTGGSNDDITVYGVSSPVTTIMGQDGNDLIHVRSTFGPAPNKTLNIDAGLGDDNVLVSGSNADTATNIFGRAGNDNISMGSSFAANNGNLANLFGTVFASGGDGSDRLYLNDAGRMSSFNYDVGPTFVRNGGGAPYFAGVNYNSTIETLRLDTTNFKNEVVVTPSFDTRFSFFGNNGFNQISLTGDPAEDGRKFFGQNGGVGFWTFSNGFRDVFFSNFLLG